MIIESDDGTENRVLPDTSLVMAFRCRGKVTDHTGNTGNDLPVSAISGLQRSLRRLRYAENTATFLVIFREGGAAAFFREPLHELFDASLPLEVLVQRRKLQDTEEQLAEAIGDAERISVVEQFLLSGLKNPQPDLLVYHAIQKISAACGNIRIAELVESFPVSRDPFEKRFRKITGASPKQFAGIVRLRHLIRTCPQAESLTAAAYTAGYFDQSHFIRDFRSFTGQTPREFFASAPWW